MAAAPAPVARAPEPKEIDLLELQNFYDMLAVSETVPVGDYEKIRLIVDSITVCYLDATDADVCENAVVPANGNVDLNPRGAFSVAAGTAILIGVDLDARKSFHVVGTGNGKIRFRPVVFVEILQRQGLQGAALSARSTPTTAASISVTSIPSCIRIPTAASRST